MSSAALVVIAPGLHSTVQDLGRWGHQSSGVPVSGAMDPYAHRLANALAGNARTAATLEITLSGPEIEFEDERVVAIAGASFAVDLDGAPVPHETPFVVHRRSRLRWGARQRGARTYLAVSGGIHVPPILGSRSTHVASGLGGHQGRALVRGDRLPLGPSSGRPAHHGAITFHETDRAIPILRVLPGPHLDRFTESALSSLQETSYSVSPQANRMGYRLEGTPLVHSRGADLLSEATPHGGLQVPGAGQPVLLMADRQTTGGYPCLSTVISADIPVAAQLAPGDRVAFEVCTPADALTALIARERTLLAIEGDR